MSLFVAGKSGNVTGRPKNSVKSVRGMVERFVKRNITPTRLQKMFSTLSAKDKMDMLLQLLPYAIAKQSPDGISNEEVEKLYALIEDSLKSKNGQQKIS